MCLTTGDLRVCHVLLGLVLSAPAFGGPTTTAATTAPAGWSALDLPVTRLSGADLYYEHVFEKDLQVARRTVEDFLQERSRQARELTILREQADKVFDRIHGILGITEDDPVKARQREWLDRYVALANSLFAPGPGTRRISFYLIRKSTLAGHLRSGLALPGLSYDPEKDMVDYQYQAKITSETGMEKVPLHLPLVVKGKRAFEEELSGVLRAYGSLGEHAVCLTLHELIELSLLHRLQPFDEPHFRWFTDGFANSLASRLTREFVEGASAEVHEVEPYADLIRDINLPYWMGKSWEVATPLESEARLEQARYAFATFEADRILDRYGLEVVKKVLDAACTAERNNSRRLFGAFVEVTGEDLRERFKRYQRFGTREEGLGRYEKRSEEAISSEDYAAALPAMLRAMELRDEYRPKDYYDIAWALFRAGHEEYGDRAILSQMERFESPQDRKALQVFGEAFIVYALKCGKPAKARPLIGDLLADDPDFVPALVILMHKHASEKEFEQARRVAQRVLQLDKNAGSSWRSIAQGILDTVPGTQTRPAEKKETPDRLELRP